MNSWISKILVLNGLFVLGMCICYAQQQSFSHYKAVDGLSVNTVNWVIQDQHGFIWIGTADGLNRFDGINFKIYRHEEDNPNSLSHSNIVALHEDQKGNIWIGTHRGLNKFDPATQSFQAFLTDMNPVTKTHHIIHIINSDKDGNIWFGSYYGLYKLSEIPGSQNIEIYEFIHDPKNPNSIGGNNIWEIFEDSKDNLWIGTHHGLDLLKKAEEKDWTSLTAIVVKKGYMKLTLGLIQ